ncbi:hypothetical protein M9Y10_035935 [Tritrichomonas musculus]|uniref:Uncharacterized protein n=1 Tax=Tritrichomonas musculus TaxID=1915356 RepID=A0ABR2GWF3_9EUKA
MYNTLIHYQNYKIFDNYNKSVNNLYNLFYEMLDEKVNENIDVYDKAKELDQYYEDVYSYAPAKFNDVRCLIIQDYKEFNPEYGKNKNKGYKTRAFTKEFVANELAKEDCTLISDYINCTTPIEYLYNGKKYHVKFGQWRHNDYRPHLGFYPYADEWAEYHARRKALNDECIND